MKRVRGCDRKRGETKMQMGKTDHGDCAGKPGDTERGGGRGRAIERGAEREKLGRGEDVERRSLSR
eukprot:749015-Hanusia_phi.AAC.2